VTDDPQPNRAEVARLLRQQAELGVREFIVATPSRERLLHRLRQAPVSVGRSEGRPGGPPTGEPGGQATGEPSAESTGSPLEGTHDEVREIALACTRCRLAKDRTHVVFSDGNPDARLMVVGEAPGANEDRTGFPFVGAAGKLLDLLLASIDLSRGRSVYICNVIKCRPPGNRNPEQDEIAACAPYLKRQIELVRPEAILAVGTFAARLLTGKDHALGELRGTIHEYQGIPLVVTYHPAALLRNSGWTRPTWEDLQLLLQLLDAERAPD
jgi:uracil-DNA glycosylase